MGGHSRFLVQEFGFEPELVERMRAGELAEGLSERELALVRYVRKVAADPKKIAPSDIQALKDHGWSNEEIVEALSTALLSAFTNTLAQSMHFEDDLERFKMDGYF